MVHRLAFSPGSAKISSQRPTFKKASLSEPPHPTIIQVVFKAKERDP